jgi:hypothetical protein
VVDETPGMRSDAEIRNTAEESLYSGGGVM